MNETMLQHEKEEQIEQAYLTSVLEKIDHRRQMLDQELSGNRRELAEAREQMWEDETQQVRTFDDVVTLSQMQQEMGTAQARFYDRLRERRMLDRLADTPYFGRIDFAEEAFVECEDDASSRSRAVASVNEVDPEDREPTETFYIGAGSVVDDDGLSRVVYDWRTPIASLFYEQNLGRVSYACPTGMMVGQLQGKRQYGIRDGKLEYWFDTDTKIDDGVLGRVLAESAQTHLKTIVKSIQQEQNQAIRAGIAQDLLIFGPAGSGKTSVGLHRCAWLLYHFRDKITPKNLLVLSNSGIFADYLTGVLPELGEQELRRTVFGSLVRALVPAGYTAQEPIEQTEYLLAQTDENDPRGVAVKSSLAFLQYLQQQMASLPLAVEPITVFDEVICTKEELEPLVVPDARGNTSDRILRFADTIAERIGDYFDLHEADLILKMRKSRETVLFEDEIPNEYMKLRYHTINQAKARFIEQNRLDAVDLYRRMLQGYLSKLGVYGVSVLQMTEQSLENRILDYADALCIAVLRVMLGEGSPMPQFVHVVLDEAQDLCAFAHCLIRLLFPKAKFTILADPMQRVAGDGSDRATLQAMYPNARLELLGKSYRSTAQISQYALQYLDADQHYDCFERDGDAPYQLSGSPEKAIEFAMQNEKQHDCHSICLLVRTREQAAAYAKRFPQFTAITDPDDTLPEGPVLLPLPLAKGLEFDAVIWFDDQKGSAHANYVMATRALHRLYILPIA